MHSLLIALLSVTLAPAQMERTMTGSTPAAGVTSIEVRGNVGSITMTSAPISDVRVFVKVTGKTQWHLFRSETGNPDQVQLRQEKHGNVLEISLFGDVRNLEEEWRVEVPESLGARLDLNVGDVKVSGIRGGCDARNNVGRIEVDVPEGNVSVVSNVGDIRIASGTTSYANVEARSSVGNVRVFMGGHAVDQKKAPGAGDSFKLSGSGRDRIRAHTDVGAVELKIR